MSARQSNFVLIVAITMILAIKLFDIIDRPIVMSYKISFTFFDLLDTAVVGFDVLLHEFFHWSFSQGIPHDFETIIEEDFFDIAPIQLRYRA